MKLLQYSQKNSPLLASNAVVTTGLIVVQNHPLVVVCSAVELLKELGPLLATAGQPVRHHHPANSTHL